MKNQALFTGLLKRSLDARKDPVYKFRIEISHIPFPRLGNLIFTFKDVSKGRRVLIIGAGPAGYFAALECLMPGINPIIWIGAKEVERT